MNLTGEQSVFLWFINRLCYARSWQVNQRPAGDNGRSSLCNNESDIIYVSTYSVNMESLKFEWNQNKEKERKGKHQKA